ncbi:c-type cytochrome [Chitinophaga flava]|uniref:Cytochrome C class I n=1 Tax=Chitinophaga flava TaxID=2259036 RepID=A0A365XWP2_9BACT|nr:c-type cytochrome [Chitinophaga flava]RBL90005.1 cytochrome C class I [Chitinophaga flava]
MIKTNALRIGAFLIAAAAVIIWSCNNGSNASVLAPMPADKPLLPRADTNAIPAGKYGEMVRYGRALMMNTAYYIGPEGVSGKYLGNRMNCTNCHQDAGTKPFSFNLMLSHAQYPQYRAREGKVLTLAERVNNCVTRPHNGKPLPLDSREMVAFLSYFRWINSFVTQDRSYKGGHNLDITFPAVAASPERGKALYQQHCARCHGPEGAGQASGLTYVYPPLWGPYGYQPGSSMHRVIKQAQWLKANMPYDKATWEKPFLTDEEALDIAAYVNDDSIHPRPDVKNYDYPYKEEKAIDYDKGPFADTFSARQHKYGPFQPIISYWENKCLKAVY